MSYRNKYNIGDLNRRVTIENWTTSQDAGGGTTATISDSTEVWARVDESGGRYGNSEAQTQYEYDNKFIVRYGVNIKSSSTIDYEGQRYAINDLEVDATGQKRFWIARATKTEVLA